MYGFMAPKEYFFNFSLRCEECKDLHLNWQILSQNLKERGMKDVVVSQVDCCIESDLCDTIDRRTKCFERLEHQENRGNLYM